MKITAIRAYQVDLPLKEGRYSWSNGNFVEVFDSTVVAIETDEGITGYAECCPLGSAYLPSYARGVRAGLEEIAPKLIGLDPTNLGLVNRTMDAALNGHPYVKAPLDIACWDLLGKASGLPLVTLLGGSAQDEVRLYRAISQEDPDQMAKKIAGYKAEGYTKFQLKVGGNADDDIARIRACREILDDTDILVADANTGWNRGTRQHVWSIRWPISMSISSSHAPPMTSACRSAAARQSLSSWMKTSPVWICSYAAWPTTHSTSST